MAESKQITDRQRESRNDLVFSYMTLRNLIGFSGMFLPLVLMAATKRISGDLSIEPSISDYYYTSTGDILVVLLSVLAVFLFTYTGYGWKEWLWTNLAAICALGVAFSPTVTKYQRGSFSVHTSLNEVPEIFGLERHLVFAATFFIAIAIISLVYFPKFPKGEQVTAAKKKRNVVYKICGWIMLACVLSLGLYFMIPSTQKALGDFPVIFALETVAIEAFAISWITKGETLWPDGEHYMVTAMKMVKENLK